MQVALIAASGTPVAPWQVQIYPVVVVVVVVVAVVAHCCCIPFQLALVLALTSAPCACTCAVFLPSTGANTSLSHVVVITHCNLCWWCFPSISWHTYLCMCDGCSFSFQSNLKVCSRYTLNNSVLTTYTTNPPTSFVRQTVMQPQVEEQSGHMTWFPWHRGQSLGCTNQIAVLPNKWKLHYNFCT